LKTSSAPCRQGDDLLLGPVHQNYSLLGALVERSVGTAMSTHSLRLATSADLSAISAIYNYYVLHSTCTYDLEPETLAERQRWFESHSPQKYPVIVAEFEGQIAGWGSLSKFRDRPGYDPTVEASVYVAEAFHRRGIGRALLEDLIARARTAGFHTILGGASADQLASIALQQSLGFEQVALFKEVGDKFGQRLDVVFMQLML
jgi:L-amino acid N-acyltransferase